MDLSTSTTLQTATMNVESPTGDNTDVQIELYSIDSDVYDSAMAEMREELVRLPDDTRKTSPEKRREIVARMYARCTKSWKGVEWQGKELELSVANAVMIYSNPGLSWLLDQVRRFMEGRRNFLPESSTD